MPLVLSIVALVCLGAWWLVASRPSQTEAGAPAPAASQTETDAQIPTASDESAAPSQTETDAPALAALQTETDAQTPTSSNEILPLRPDISEIPPVRLERAPDGSLSLPAPPASVVGTPRIEGGTLDFNNLPTYGSVELTAFFSPDPYTIEVVSGGEVDASYLGGACVGHAAEAPEVRLSWSGASAQLRIFFNAPGGEDSSLLVNLPDGSWLCNDDTDGLNPEVLLSDAPEGQYDIWVGSYERGEFISGTLSISEIATIDSSATPPPTEPVRVGGNITPPTKTKDVAPIYPAVAQSARVSGVVILEAVIGVAGRVTDVKVLRSVALLDDAAVAAVRQWEYTPTMMNGSPVPVIMTVTVNFTLR